MNESLAETSVSLWLLSFAVLVLAAQLGFGYLRQAQREATRRGKVWRWLAAGAALGVGLWSAMLLGISSQGLTYSLGFSALQLLAACGVMVLAAWLALALPLRWRRLPALVAAGVLLGAGVCLLHVMLVRAAGLEPGLVWQKQALALAAPVAASGCVAGLWVAFLGAGRSGAHRRRWRLAAAGMFAFGVLGAQELVLVAAAMGTQKASGFIDEVPAEVVCLVAGLAIPFAGLMLLLAQRLRRLMPDSGVPPQRKRRRVRVRPLA